MAESINFNQVDGGADASGDRDGVRVFVFDRTGSWSSVKLTISEDDARAWARQLTLAADEAADAAIWTPDEEQIAAYQAANSARLGSGFGVSQKYAIEHLRSLHDHGLRL